MVTQGDGGGGLQKKRSSGLSSVSWTPEYAPKFGAITGKTGRRARF